MKTFEDERGIIEDLKVGKDWSITYISFKKGAVRGNHYHNATTQTDYILSGSVVLSTPHAQKEMSTGEYQKIKPGIPHAYKALEDSEMVSICNGVRIGENYEEDTFRLDKKLTFTGYDNV
jgi:quercetin dioxygenase-like cupin family protein